MVNNGAVPIGKFAIKKVADIQKFTPLGWRAGLPSILNCQDSPFMSWRYQREEPIMSRVELNTPAPEFTLSDFNGNSVSISDFIDRKNVLAVFNRGFL